MASLPQPEPWRNLALETERLLGEHNYVDAPEDLVGDDEQDEQHNHDCEDSAARALRSPLLSAAFAVAGSLPGAARFCSQLDSTSTGSEWLLGTTPLRVILVFATVLPLADYLFESDRIQAYGLHAGVVCIAVALLLFQAMSTPESMDKVMEIFWNGTALYSLGWICPGIVMGAQPDARVPRRIKVLTAVTCPALLLTGAAIGAAVHSLEYALQAAQASTVLYLSWLLPFLASTVVQRASFGRAALRRALLGRLELARRYDMLEAARWSSATSVITSSSNSEVVSPDVSDRGGDTASLSSSDSSSFSSTSSDPWGGGQRDFNASFAAIQGLYSGALSGHLAAEPQIATNRAG